jgi:quercetin dioxygenase-like cupin family protein
MDVRSIEDRAPRVEHEGTTTVWWMYDAREAFDQTSGGHLELVSEFEVAGGSAVHPHAHPTHEYYYVLSGRGEMTIGDETREIGPGDLVSIPPQAIHSLAPVTVHAPIHCLAFAVGVPGAGPIDYTSDGGSADGERASGPPEAMLRGARYRSIRDLAPALEHQGSVAVWWLVAPGELAPETAGGHLELANEFEVAGGGAVHTHSHPTYEFYYGLTGRGIMTIDGEDREVAPGDLVVIAPDAPHSIRPLSDHAPIRCFCFAVGLAGSGAYDYAHDHAADG